MTCKGWSIHPPSETDSDEGQELTRSFFGGEPTVEQTRPFELFNLEHLWRRSATPKPWTPDTRTESSFRTPPELPAPSEQLFATILNRKNQQAQPVMPAMEVDPKPTPAIWTPEIRGGKITPFSGKWETLKKFIETIQLHLILNKIKEDEDKIVFALTFMEGGDAESWKMSFLKKKASSTTNSINFGKWSNFLNDLRKSFKPYDKKISAIDEIIKLWQGTGSIEDHVAKFKVLLEDSGVEENSPATLDYFMKSIRTPLLRKILDLPDPPDTLEKWYEWALKFDANYHRLQWILNRGSLKTNTNEAKPWWAFCPQKDPNAMDIDVITRTYNAMTPEERTKLMRKGCCFQCKKPGHLSHDCPEKKGKNTIPTTPNTSTTTTVPKKMTAKELTAHIRSLTALLDKEEKDEFYNKAEKEGFWSGDSDWHRPQIFPIFTLCTLIQPQIQSLCLSQLQTWVKTKPLKPSPSSIVELEENSSTKNMPSYWGSPSRNSIGPW